MSPPSPALGRKDNDSTWAEANAPTTMKTRMSASLKARRDVLEAPAKDDTMKMDQGGERGDADRQHQRRSAGSETREVLGKGHGGQRDGGRESDRGGQPARQETDGRMVNAGEKMCTPHRNAGSAAANSAYDTAPQKAQTPPISQRNKMVNPEGKSPT